MGAFNGLLVAYGRVPAIIVTLGTLAIYRTLLVEISGANSVVTNELPKWLIDLPRLNVASFGDLDIRLLFMLALVVVVIFQLVATYLPGGGGSMPSAPTRMRRGWRVFRQNASSSPPM